MKYKVLHDSGAERTFAMIFDTGDEVTSLFSKFAEENHLWGSRFTGIGACSDVVLGWFDPERKEYKNVHIDEQVEVLSFVGDVALEDDASRVHAHVVVGKSDGTAHGGHLLKAFVRPTLEIILVESPEYLRRKHDPETGLALIDLGDTAEIESST